ncbi:MAG: HDIG domain-containing metalloprotein [Chloroflexota bacterium]
MSSNSNHTTGRRGNILPISLLIFAVLLSAASLLFPLANPTGTIPLVLGDVSTQDILAPVSLSYQSEVLTEQNRQAAADAIPAQYNPPDTSIARSQVRQLHDTLNFINTVRSDAFATVEQKAADLAALQNINLTPESTGMLLDLGDPAWQTVQQETITVLEQVMRSTIREDRLEDARRGIPALVSLSISEEQAELVTELVSAFVAANSLYSLDLTEEMRSAARQAVEPVPQSYIAGETIVRRGQVVTEESLEALDNFGLLTNQITWKDYLSVFALVAVNFGFVALYFSQRPDLRTNNLSLTLVTVLFLITLISARLLIVNRTVVPYMFPVASFSMLVAALISSRAGLILALPLGILTAYALPNSLELTLFYLFSSAFGVLMIRNVQRLLTFFWAGLGVAVSGAAVVLSFHLLDPTSDAIGIITLIGAAAFNGVASAAVTIFLQFFLAQVLGYTTTLQLIDISRPDHPLLQFILRNAPGTYQHSLQIANLAEQAAERIEADALLTRVGALYHDAGKARLPYYFIENQIEGAHNPHDDLSPLESSEIIIRHVTDGVELAVKYRMPKRIKDFILEHHGTMLTRYQYHKALEAAGGDAQLLQKEDFRYPGPRPQSRETALVMLADGVEARSRAERPENEEEIYAMVKDLITKRLNSGQLDDTALTMLDLNKITESFSTTLRGIHHPRIQYPSNQLEAATQPAASTVES